MWKKHCLDHLLSTALATFVFHALGCAFASEIFWLFATFLNLNLRPLNFVSQFFCLILFGCYEMLNSCFYHLNFIFRVNLIFGLLSFVLGSKIFSFFKQHFFELSIFSLIKSLQQKRLSLFDILLDFLYNYLLLGCLLLFLNL